MQHKWVIQNINERDWNLEQLGYNSMPLNCGINWPMSLRILHAQPHKQILAKLHACLVRYIAQ